MFLLAASYFFYGYWNWKFTLLLFICSTGNYLFGLGLGQWEEPPKRNALVFLALIFNLGILFFFKYFDFFASSLNNLFLAWGLSSQLPILNLVLPVGISFFTFQAMSYVLDVYRKELPPVLAWGDILLYISFFPQLVAGPIVRAKDFLPQLKEAPSYANVRADKAFLLIISGIFKKVIVAHYLASLLVDRVFDDPAAFSSLELLLGMYGYAIQIYCDFSAYSDIAIGVAALLGYNFPQNFRHPYRASSLQEFWRRWHITLSTWLRDYLYIPLGGSRKGKIRTYINLMLTMLLGGIWHGAAWNFVFWGLLHGTGLSFERLLFKPRQADSLPWYLKVLGMFFTFHYVCIGWVFFRSGSLEAALLYLRSLLVIGLQPTLLSPFLLLLIILGLGVHLLPEGTGKKLRILYNRIPLVLQGIIFGLFLVCIGAMSPEGVAPFIYFQF